MLSNGEFAYDSYGSLENEDAAYLWVMFLLCSFINMIVFMNMLIAIMGETFNQVMEASKQSGLQEMVTLMADNLWVLNLEELFKS